MIKLRQKLRGVTLVTLLVADLAAGSAAMAKSICWTAAEVSAARVRTMDTMLMVQALRCRNQDATAIDHYNAFLTEDKKTINSALGVLRGHFARQSGAGRAADALDKYSTRIANRYGAGMNGYTCPQLADLLAQAKPAGKTIAGLSDLAVKTGVAPETDGGFCPVKSARPKARRHK